MTARSHRVPVVARGLEAALAIGGIACLGWWAWQVTAADRFQREAAIELARQRAVAGARPARAVGSRATPDPVPAASPTSRTSRQGASLRGVVGRIDIPAARISAMVAAGDDKHTLARAVGLLPGTARPGERGRTVLAGHRDTWFRGLDRVHRGDVIRMTTATGTYQYRVTRMRIVEPSDVGVLETGPDPGLTLVTCWPFQYVGPAPERYIVQAALVGSDDRGVPLATLAATAQATPPPPARVAASHAVRPARARAQVHVAAAGRGAHEPRLHGPRPARRPAAAAEDATQPAKVKRVWDDHWALH